MNNVEHSSFRCDFERCKYWQNPEGTKAQRKKAARKGKDFNPAGECRASRKDWRKCSYRYYKKEAHEFLEVGAAMLEIWELVRDFKPLRSDDDYVESGAYY